MKKTIIRSKNIIYPVIFILLAIQSSCVYVTKTGVEGIAQNYTYKNNIQKPGAPDMLLINAPESDKNNSPVKISIQGKSVLFHRPDDIYNLKSTSAKRPHRNVLKTPLKVDINRVPFDFYMSDFSRSVDECHVNFNDSGALSLTVPSLWFDRIYLPWFQACGGGGGDFVDFRPLVNSHLHLPYENPDVVPCPDNDQAFPGIVDEDMCNLVDVPTEPRTYLITHTSSEYIYLRSFQNNNQKTTFALNQISIEGINAVRICYRKEQEVDLSWLTSAVAEGTIPGFWLCWSGLNPGVWDLSNYLWNVTDVKFTGADGSAGPFSIDDLFIVID